MAGLFSGIDGWGKENSILNQFLFPAPRSSYTWDSFPYPKGLPAVTVAEHGMQQGELVCVVGREGNIVPCTLMPGAKIGPSVGNKPCELREEPATCLVIYCHANGEDLGVLNEAGHWILDTLGVHMLIPEYPGYGMAPGKPHEASVTANILTAYDFAVNALHWDPKNIILFGRSIGTGPAIKLAAQIEIGGLILVSPYTSIKDIVRTHAGFVTSWLTAELSNMFPSEEDIVHVLCPTLIVHGSQDKVIPSESARRLHSASKAANKRLVLLEGIGHHGIDLHFAVAHECPAFFNLNGYPKVLNLDQFLCDPLLQGDTVASPSEMRRRFADLKREKTQVPACDMRSMSWSRPSLPSGSIPYLKDQATPETAPQSDTGISLYWTFESQGHKQVITDEVLLSRIQRSGIEQEQDFFLADRLEKKEKQKKQFHGGSHARENELLKYNSGKQGVDDDLLTYLGRTSTSSENSAADTAAADTAAADTTRLSWRTDIAGKVVESTPPLSARSEPQSKPGPQDDKNLFVY